MLHKKRLSMAVSAAIGTAFAMGMTPVNAQEESLVEEVVVTGSRIQRANLVSSSPVTQLDNEQLEFTGLNRVEDALSAIPGISLDQSSGQAIESIGTATMQLRNLGTTRTLVLMNGRRLPANSPQSPSAAADINMIPGNLIQRVEVLTGGASSTYGADAVAGVVNFVMQDDFQGVELDYQYSGLRHNNDGNVVADAAEQAGQPFASGTTFDGETTNVSLIIGGNFDNDRGNVTAFGSYREIAGVTQINRDYSACPVRDSLTCLGSATNESGSIIATDENADGGNYRVEGNQLAEGFGPGFNFAAPSFLQRPDERVVLGTFAHYDLNEHVEAYTELMFMDTKSTTQFGPAGFFFNPTETNCNNPLMSDQQRDVLGCQGPDDTVDLVIGRRAVEGGPRFGNFRHSTYRGVFGVRGDINDAWRYDVSYQYAEVDMNNRNGNYFDIDRFPDAISAVPGPDGEPVCPPGADDGCVPYDLWNTGGVTPEASQFLEQRFFEWGTTSQEVLMAFAQGSLGEYGITSPFAESGVELVVGYEFREETLKFDGSDNVKRQGTIVETAGRYDVNEFYFEANIPVIEDVTLIQSLSLDVGYRYSEYSFGPTTDTYKFAGSWAIDDNLKLRGSVQRAVRAPNVVDLFRPEVGTLYAMDRDPCAKANPGDALSESGYSFEQCARSGVTQAVWDQGGPQSNPASQYNSVVGGSTELQPEEADTLTAGFIFTPSFAEGLTLSVDWYDIEIEKAIQGVQPETTLVQCIQTGNPLFCDSINRGLNDSLWLGQARLAEGEGSAVDERSTNIGFLATSGVDVEITYNFDIGDLGTINIANIAGFVLSFEQEEFPGAGVIDCEGTYGGPCGFPIPELKNRMQVTWATPWNVTGSLIWRHVSGSDQEFTSVPNDLEDMNYLDLAANWEVNDWASVRVGVNNVFDEEPPFVYQGVTARENGNTFPGIYDPLGQYLFAGFTLRY